MTRSGIEPRSPEPLENTLHHSAMQPVDVRINSLRIFIILKFDLEFKIFLKYKHFR